MDTSGWPRKGGCADTGSAFSCPLYETARKVTHMTAMGGSSSGGIVAYECVGTHVTVTCGWVLL